LGGAERALPAGFERARMTSRSPCTNRSATSCRLSRRRPICTSGRCSAPSLPRLPRPVIRALDPARRDVAVVALVVAPALREQFRPIAPADRLQLPDQPLADVGNVVLVAGARVVERVRRRLLLAAHRLLGPPPPLPPPALQLAIGGDQFLPISPSPLAGEGGTHSEAVGG